MVAISFKLDATQLNLALKQTLCLACTSGTYSTPNYFSRDTLTPSINYFGGYPSVSFFAFICTSLDRSL